MHLYLGVAPVYLGLFGTICKSNTLPIHIT